ncbi:glycosyltransferase [Kineococcus sp. R8]|nr:glycosyltransferase family 1 protein [Kineococcus siccus]NAZ81105.1 glycosyltransferase [Kineococcus siccus]
MTATQVPASGTGGGIVRYTVELARALRARADVDLSVLVEPAAQPFFADLLGSAAAVHTVPALPTAARSLLERWGTGSAALRRPFDVVQGTKHLLPRSRRGRQVLTVHDMLTLDRPQEFNAMKRALLSGPYLASLRQADRLLCVSAATRDRLLAHVPDVAERAVVVPLAPSPSLSSVPAEEVGRLSGTPFALVVGDPSPRKNLGFVVDLWPDVVARHPGAVLAVVGPPSWGPTALGALHRQLGETGALAALGHVSEARLRWLYENAAVVLCPSLAEGFGLPAAEALALGARVVTSEDPALCEVSGPEARHLPVSDRSAWVEAVGQALLAGPRRLPPGARASWRSWDDVAAETVDAARQTAGGAAERAS